MARILAVDDREANRLLLSSILTPFGHIVFEASDGAEALIAAEQSRPDVIITDILMPTMDGFELVRRIRASAALCSIPVIFYTAHYEQNEARDLAAECGVSEVIRKPVDPSDMLRVVDRVLSSRATTVAAQPSDRFDQEHRTLVTDKLVQKTTNLRNANLRLRALTEIGLQVNLHRNRDEFAPSFCRAARSVVSASCVTVVFTGSGESGDEIYSSGVDPAGEAALKGAPLREVLARLIHPDQLRRGFNPGGDPRALDLPGDYPPIYSFVVVRVASATRAHGLLVFSNILDTDRFTAEDEMLAAVLAAQLAVACDNDVLLEDARRRSEELERQLERELAMEEALRRSQQQLSAILENTNAVVYLVDPEGNILLANRAAQRVFQAPELPIDGALYERLPAAAAAQFRARDHKVLVSGESMESEDIIPHGDGDHSYLVTRFPLLDSAGKIYAVGAIATDFTAQKEIQEQLRQAQRMESIGRLAGGVAHDFNNMLTVINGYSSMLLNNPRSSRVEEKLRHIQKAGETAAAMTRQLLAFSRRQLLEPRVIQIDEVLVRISGIMQRMIGENIDVVVRPGPETGPVQADPAQIEQVVMNLAVNARDAMPQGGVLTIACGNASLPDPAVPGLPEARPGDYVFLSVADTGTGIEDSVKAHMFEPYFTTKPKDKGTGLGLSTVYGIVHQSGGWITVESSLGKGSTFSIYLPRHGECAAAGEEEDPETTRGDETVLLVEDDDSVRTFGDLALKAEGYNVVSFARPEEAIAFFEQGALQVDLLITDVVMPVMNGKELAERVRAAQPDVKVLFVSGYSFDVFQGYPLEGAELLAKPFTQQSLTTKVREVLGMPGQSSFRPALAGPARED